MPVQERLTKPDISAYIGHKNNKNRLKRGGDQTKLENQTALKYYLEKKNGELIQHMLPLDGSVEKLLSSLSAALETTGLAVKKAPDLQSSSVETALNKTNDLGDDINNNNSNNDTSTTAETSFGRINHSYDVNTNRGRNLFNFIESLDFNEIEQRKANRIDATAAALVARQAYKFQSIDGTHLGWSSSSLAKTLRMLTKVFDEHSDKFNVESFYPLQLYFSNDEFHSKLDLYSGTIMLNPGSTQEQWLETLMAVTNKDLDILQTHRKEQKSYLSQGQNYLNANIRKGFSCSSKEYYDFLERLACEESSRNLQSVVLQPTSWELALGRLNIVVETSQACRRPVTTNIGDIRISSLISPCDILSSIHKLKSDALRKSLFEKEQRNRTKELVSMMKFQFGLAKVFKSRLMTVTSDQYLNALTKILQSGHELEAMKNNLAGTSIGITHAGSFCHLGDDGSLMIPWNFKIGTEE